MQKNFLHIGMTVSSIDRTVAFYEKYFGFQKVGETGVFSEEFISSHNSLYRQAAGTYSNFCFLRSEDGIELELFEFHPLEGQEPAVWNRPGFHHICLRVDDMDQTYRRMLADGVKFFFPPDCRALPTEHWVFLEDPDGNLIELQD